MFRILHYDRWIQRTMAQPILDSKCFQSKMDHHKTCIRWYECLVIGRNGMGRRLFGVRRDARIRWCCWECCRYNFGAGIYDDDRSSVMYRWRYSATWCCFFLEEGKNWVNIKILCLIEEVFNSAQRRIGEFLDFSSARRSFQDFQDFLKFLGLLEIFATFQIFSNFSRFLELSEICRSSQSF